MRPQLVALIVAASLTTGWLLASIVSPPVAKLQDLPPREAQRAESVDQAADTSYTERLNLRLQKVPAPPVPRRNPFVFADRARPESRIAPETPSAISPLETAPIATGPVLRLAGIGSFQTESGVVLTAIVSDGRSVHLARAGEPVLGFTVIEVTEQSAVLAAADGTRHVLRLP